MTFSSITSGGYIAVQIFETLPTAAASSNNGYPGALATAIVADTSYSCTDAVCWVAASFPSTVFLDVSSTYYLVVSVPAMSPGGAANPIYYYQDLADLTLGASSGCPSEALSSATGTPSFSNVGSGIAFALYGSNMGSE